MKRSKVVLITKGEEMREYVPIECLITALVSRIS